MQAGKQYVAKESNRPVIATTGLLTTHRNDRNQAAPPSLADIVQKNTLNAVHVQIPLESMSDPDHARQTIDRRP